MIAIQRNKNSIINAQKNSSIITQSVQTSQTIRQLVTEFNQARAYGREALNKAVSYIKRVDGNAQETVVDHTRF